MKMSRGKREQRRDGGRDREGGKRKDRLHILNSSLQRELLFVRVGADAPDTLASVSSVNRLARRANQMQRDS